MAIGALGITVQAYRMDSKVGIATAWHSEIPYSSISYTSFKHVLTSLSVFVLPPSHC